MHTVTSGFKSAIKNETRTLYAYLKDTDAGTQINENDDLKAIKIVTETSLLKTVLRKAYIEYYSTHDYLDKTVEIGIGVEVSGSAEYINYGKFKVTKYEQVKDKEFVKLEAYDLMYESLKEFKLDASDITYPTTLKGLLQAICTKLGWTIGTSTFPNDGTALASDELTGVIKTYRQALDMIAEASGSIIYFNEDNELIVQVIDTTNTNVDTLTLSEEMTLDIKPEFGEVDAITLARDPQNDNVIQLSNEVINGDMELNSNWSDRGTPTTREQSSTQSHSGTYSQHFEIDASFEGINSDSFTLKNNHIYKVGVWVYLDGTTSFRILISKGDNSGYDVVNGYWSGMTANAWNYQEFEFTSSTDGDLGYIAIDGGSNTSGSWYVDDVTIFDQTMDRNEIKISNNWLVDDDRTTWITEIFDNLEDLKFKPFVTKTIGLLYFEIGDRIGVTDLASTVHSCVILGYEIKMTGGLKETLFAKHPDKAKSDYNTAGVVGQKITNTEIKVDKVEGEITLINTDLDDNYYTSAEITILTDSITSSVQSVSDAVSIAQAGVDTNAENIATNVTDITTLEQRADAIEITVEGIGGTNLLKNSVGLKNDVEAWQEYDVDGNLVDSDNDATIDQSTDVTINGESGSALRLDGQYLFQTVATIQGETYTLYMRYKSNLDAILNITGIGDITISANADWQVYKYQWTATDDTCTIKFTNVSSGAGAYIIMTDITAKLGDANGWIQAPNEVYGKNYRFDKDGFQITSPTDDFKSLLDNQKLAVYDTSGGSDKVVMLVSKDSGIVTKLTAQDELIIQRYDNSDASTRIIPTSTGSMLVINDK